MAAAVFVLTYVAGYRRHARRVMASLESADDGPGLPRLPSSAP